MTQIIHRKGLGTCAYLIDLMQISTEEDTEGTYRTSIKKDKECVHTSLIF